MLGRSGSRIHIRVPFRGGGGVYLAGGVPGIPTSLEGTWNQAFASENIIFPQLRWRAVIKEFGPWSP